MSPWFVELFFNPNGGFKPSGFHMPQWWQKLWRRRYPMGVHGQLILDLVHAPGLYFVEPMACGCGYRVFFQDDDNWAKSQVGSGHSPTLRGAIRRARRHATGL